MRDTAHIITIALAPFLGKENSVKQVQSTLNLKDIYIATAFSELY